jgi:tetratricopeptide (TPR) repeat protein
MRRIIPISILLTGLALLYPMQRWIDTNLPREVINEETLYFSSGEKIKKMSLGFDGLVAEIYWIRAVQYFGRKLTAEENLSIANLRDIRMDLLAPYLDIVVTLDPHHIPAYRFGAIFLPERDVAAAINLLERGIRENPDQWRLYQDIGYIHWQMKDYEKAADWFERGGRIEGARWWMRDLAGVMRIKGGSRDVARAVYTSYLESEDENIRTQAELRLLQLRAFDEIDAINIFLDRLKDQPLTCQAKLRSLARRLNKEHGIAFNEEMMPLDPSGYPYEIDPATCQVKIARESKVPVS